MRVLVPTMLRSYTGGAAEVAAEGTTVAEVLEDLERQFRGIRFRVIDEQDRVRQHVRIFVAGEVAADLAMPVPGDAVLQIVGALSGG